MPVTRLPIDRNIATYLDVPYREKGEAKALGARWDAEASSWYAPKYSTLKLFGKWLTGEDRQLYELDELDRQSLKLRSEQWKNLPPRSEDPATIVRLGGHRIFRVSNQAIGRCLMCDSHLATEWVVKATDSGVMEFWHLSDRVDGPIRPTEMAILDRAIMSGFRPDAC